MIQDVIIIGGSFAGLSAAMQLARGRRRVTVIDSGEPRNRFSEQAHGFFAYDGTPPRDLIRAGREKVAAYPTVSFIEGEAVAVSGGIDDFTVRTAGDEEIHGRRLILAFGLRDNLPDIPGLRDRWGTSVVHCPYCHGYELADSPLGVLHINNLSWHQALMIPEWGATTYFLNGGPMPDEDVAAYLKKREICIEPSRIVTLCGDAPHLSQVRLEDGRVLPLQGLYIAPRTEMNSSIADQLGCTFEEGVFGPTLDVDSSMATSVPGVYACGDIARIAHNATLASADGVTAGVSAHKSLIMMPLGL